MKKIFVVVFTLFILLLSSGCYNYKEINEMAIVSSIGIDKDDKNDKYIVSAQIMNSKESEDSEDSQIIVYTKEGDTIHEALRNVTLESPRKLYGNHLSKIVLSEEVAKEGIDNVLDTFNRLSEVRNEFIITVVKDNKASDVLKVLTSTETIPAEYVKLSLKIADETSGLTYTTKLDEFISLYLKKGIDPVVPVLKIDKKSKKGTTIDNITTTDPMSKIVIENLAVTNKGKLETYLKSEEVIGYNFLRNQIQKMIIPVKCDDKNNYASIAILKNKTKSNTSKKDNKYIINFDINSEAIITEYNCESNLKNEKVIEKLEKDTEKKINRYIKKSLDKQKETKGKFLGLERLIYLDYPKYKNEDYSVKYNVKVNLVRKGEIRNSIKGENNYE
ncbi:MAG: Ger(x)C family spore germination protein [Bacilli bacterium]|jgi:spore germination protein KC|nr:Ger(x)C family spore germination protein [Bacilli bacterium]